FVAVAEGGAPEPRHALEVGLALAVVDEHSLPALDDQRTGFAQGREVGVGVNEGLEVADGEIAKRRHGFAFGLSAIAALKRAGVKRRPPPGRGRTHEAREPGPDWRNAISRQAPAVSPATPRPVLYPHGAADAGRGRGSGTCAASSPGSRTSHWHMRWPPTRSARSTWTWFS